MYPVTSTRRTSGHRNISRWSSHTWELFSVTSGRILGAYSQTNLRAALRDAAIMRGAGIVCDVRKAV